MIEGWDYGRVTVQPGGLNEQESKGGGGEPGLWGCGQGQALGAAAVDSAARSLQGAEQTLQKPPGLSRVWTGGGPQEIAPLF